MALLRVDQLTKSFGGLLAVNQVNFEIGQGEIVGLIGPNGAGKTTVFNLISGLLDRAMAKYFWARRRLPRLSLTEKAFWELGETFQIVRPFEGMTVLENVMVPTLARHRDPKEARRLLQRFLRKWGWLRTPSPKRRI